MCIEIFSDRKLSIINQLKVTTWYRKIPFVCAAQLIHPIKGCVSSLEPRLRRKLHTVYSTTKPVKETKRSCNDSTCLEELEREETLAGMQDIRETAATPGTAGIIAVQAATAHTLETSMDRVVRTTRLSAVFCDGSFLAPEETYLKHRGEKSCEKCKKNKKDCIC